MTRCSSMAFSLRSWPMTSPSARRSDEGLSGSSRETNRSPKRVLGSSRAVTSAGICSRYSGLMASSMVAPSVLGRDLAHLADDHAAHLDVGRLLQLVAGGVGLQRHPGDLGERLVVHRHRQAEQQREHDQERHALQPAADHAALSWSSSRPHPAIRTVVVEPQMARDRNRSMMLIATIEKRTARPTAMPTPAGPPLAR